MNRAASVTGLANEVRLHRNTDAFQRRTGPNIYKGVLTSRQEKTKIRHFLVEVSLSRLDFQILKSGLVSAILSAVVYILDDTIRHDLTTQISDAVFLF